ncbi:MAG TPA: hypothetical protein VNZ52_04030 [Candidatus Thermoplasmatota archaeon]|nr:hypothetical protein [Candidatus Thermoplasmatota archaeon]
MPSPNQHREATSAAAVEDLGTVVIQKRLFLSNWYENAARDLLPPDHLRQLERIREETREEIDRTHVLVERWAREEPNVRELRESSKRARSISTHEFLKTVIDAKEATANAYERAAVAAPTEELRREFLMLAGIDFAHARLVQEILLRIESDHPKQPRGEP